MLLKNQIKKLNSNDRNVHWILIKKSTNKKWPDIIEENVYLNKNIIALVDETQIFFDISIAETALKNSGYKFDYFTQWEHCRLPVGIGCRALNLNNSLISNWTGTLEELITYIQNNPQQFKIYYDNKQYVSYENSLLDACYNKGANNLPERLKNHQGGLETFLNLSAKHQHNFSVLSTEKTKCIDECGLPSTHGFESVQCANFPTYIMFDITNACNSQCIHCPHSLPEFKKKHNPKFLNLTKYKKVIDECSKYNIDFIRITADGEPLLHSQLEKMLSYPISKGIKKIGLTTNGSLMNDQMASQIINTGLFMIDFSLDAATPETYKKIRKGLSYKNVIRNIVQFIKTKNELNSNIKVMVSFVKQRENFHEVEKFQKLWKSRVDKVLIREKISNINFIDLENKMITSPKRWPCTHLFRRIVINYEGLMKMCPVDWKNETQYKSIDKTSIYDAWHSNFYHKHRIEHLNCMFSRDSACKECPDWQGKSLAPRLRKNNKNIINLEQI